MKRRAPVSPEELGSPVAHLALGDGTPVYDREGKRIGVVEHVDAPSGIFEGIVIHTYPLPGRHLYADVHQVAELRERGVLLSVGRDDLHDPELESARRRRHRSLEARLRHAWDWISGQAR